VWCKMTSCPFWGDLKSLNIYAGIYKNLRNFMEPYIPKSLPLKTEIDWASHITSVGKANATIARYDGILTGIVNPNVLLSPLLFNEAVLSSRIEGTQASLEEVLHYEADNKNQIDNEKEKDIHEILNYRRALLTATGELKNKPFCINLIRDLHRVLLAGVRGRDREPGEIRRIQNWIAPPGTPIAQATFIPPEPRLVMDALSNWENYAYFDEKDPLVQLAILKAQFELIHPFRDGNGRMGRMLVPLILYNRHILKSPMFYISAYLEKNRDVYYDRLLAISQEEKWNEWISFFLQAITEQATENGQRAIAILNLYSEMKDKVPKITRSPYSIKAIDGMFSRPIFSTPNFVSALDTNRMTAQRILDELVKNDIVVIQREGKGSRATIYGFPRLLTIIAT
jgi:Fic family protein